MQRQSNFSDDMNKLEQIITNHGVSGVMKMLGVLFQTKFPKHRNLAASDRTIETWIKIGKACHHAAIKINAALTRPDGDNRFTSFCNANLFEPPTQEVAVHATGNDGAERGGSDEQRTSAVLQSRAANPVS